MLTQEDNELLTSVGKGTPMGELFRQFWQPCVPAARLVAGGAPVSVPLLGEPLIAFRSPDGAIGVIDERCPHRCASLRLGWNEDDGLRCLYHGWKVSLDGTILETPTEPADSVLKDRIRQPAYPCREAGGLVWVYLGENDPPPLPQFEFCSSPLGAISNLVVKEDCNWAQSLEGVIDSAHATYLHRQYYAVSAQAVETGSSVYDDDFSYMTPSAATPTLDLERTPLGFRYGAIRSLTDSETPSRHVRITHFVVPNVGVFPGPDGWGAMQFFVPIDDHTTRFFYVQFRRDGKTISAEDHRQLEEIAGLRPGIDIDDDYVKAPNRRNAWLQDRAAMVRGSGITGVVMEDAAIQESMGPIVDRTREHLGRTDRAIINFRRIVLQTAREFRETGENNYRPSDSAAYLAARASEGIISEDQHWTSVAGDSEEG